MGMGVSVCGPSSVQKLWLLVEGGIQTTFTNGTLLLYLARGPPALREPS